MDLVTLVVALVLIAIAWKVLGGLIKFAAIAIVLIVAVVLVAGAL